MTLYKAVINAGSGCGWSVTIESDSPAGLNEEIAKWCHDNWNQTEMECPSYRDDTKTTIDEHMDYNGFQYEVLEN